jgi:hypothetical protein
MLQCHHTRALMRHTNECHTNEWHTMRHTNECDIPMNGTPGQEPSVLLPRGAR